ncbi:hypothetical protein AYI68_g4648 [Smittium mucronatum]|uniref:Uncharacterized protein n=1 Tax=Smittium mucronatum TaxID=133383 RepID=A0A1R0GWH6_9FUNG|nr:hypothetical protein AYI68_g4648 [Smittium mucronatum]
MTEADSLYSLDCFKSLLLNRCFTAKDEKKLGASLLTHSLLHPSENLGQILHPYSDYIFFAHYSMRKAYLGGGAELNETPSKEDKISSITGSPTKRRTQKDRYLYLPPPLAKCQPPEQIHKDKHRTRATHGCA